MCWEYISEQDRKKLCCDNTGSKQNDQLHSILGSDKVLWQNLKKRTGDRYRKVLRMIVESLQSSNIVRRSGETVLGRYFRLLQISPTHKSSSFEMSDHQVK